MSKSKSMPITALFKGIITSYCITMAVFVIYAILLTYTDISESFVSPTAMITTGISCIICGFITAKSAGKRGIVWGVLAGICYIALMLTLGVSTIPGWELSQKMIISIIIAAAGGAIGGILGVNR